MKRKSQVTASKIDQLTQSKYTSSIQKSKEALDRLKVTPQIYADFPETKLENAKLVFEAQDLNFLYDRSNKPLWKKPITVSIRGPRKVSLEGKNGSGKSTFLKLLMGMPSIPGQLSGKLKLGLLNFSYLDQSLHLLDLTQTVLENVRSTSQKDQSSLRNLLAQFLFSGEKVNQVTQTLSGGEKLRLALAKSLLADPVPKLLILDEPTNNIDVSNLEFLEVALAEFKGAILVVSHDSVFLENLGIDLRINLEDHI